MTDARNIRRVIALGTLAASSPALRSAARDSAEFERKALICSHYFRLDRATAENRLREYLIAHTESVQSVFEWVDDGRGDRLMFSLPGFFIWMREEIDFCVPGAGIGPDVLIPGEHRA